MWVLIGRCTSQSCLTWVLCFDFPNGRALVIFLCLFPFASATLAFPFTLCLPFAFSFAFSFSLEWARVGVNLHTLGWGIVHFGKDKKGPIALFTHQIMHKAAGLPRPRQD